MIRFLRMLSILFCIAAVFTYGGVNLYTKGKTDRSGPEIHMEENEITISTQDGLDAVLSGVKAEDKKDGDVSDLLVVESMSNFVEKGIREATIAAFDNDGNVTKTVRKVSYSDYTSPRINLTGPLRSLVSDTTKLINSVYATDCLDGDVTANVQITSKESVSSISPGTYKMHIQVANSAGDVTDLPVTVELYDYTTENTGFQIVLNQYLVYTKAGQRIDPYAYLKGIVQHGEEYDWGSETPPELLKENVEIRDSVDYNTPGTYEIKYTAENANGSRGVVRLVVVVEE